MSQGTLEDFKTFVTENSFRLSNLIKILNRQQEKFETYFNEVKKVREHELEQITEHVVADRSSLGEDMNNKLDAALKSEREAFDKKLLELQQKKKKLDMEAEKLRATSAEEEKKLRTKNIELDKREEALKSRNEKLIKRINEYNRRIREMNKGFGFVRNIFRMRRIQRERKALDEEQANLAYRIDSLRKSWEELDSDFTREEKERKEKWLELTTDSAAIKTKIDHLDTAREQIIQRSALEKVLFAKRVSTPKPAADDPRCPRCSVPNPKSAHFCRICALRLGKDRKDLTGSLEEIAELNQHYVNFSKGMKSSQEMIGLLNGIKTGLDKFSDSVLDMIKTKQKYGLTELILDIPEQSIDYANKFNALASMVDNLDKSLHPSEFSSQINTFIADVFTKEKIEDFFENMGRELSQKADAQW